MNAVKLSKQALLDITAGIIHHYYDNKINNDYQKFFHYTNHYTKESVSF